MKYVSVEGHSNLVKDKRTGAVLNVGTNFEQLRKNKEARKKQQIEFNELKNEVGEMKDLLKQIIKKMEI
jgi:HAMP domain-containing protein|tara:strand:- start:1566 stop:1772 length:207 start_codon:yes stop_codon:yes gene_type:complete